MLTLGCATPTTFQGASTVKGGRGGCEAKCAKQGLELTAMVFVGEYSDGCVCEKRKPVASRSTRSTAGTSAAVAGVVIQQQQAEQQRQQQQHQHHYYHGGHPGSF